MDASQKAQERLAKELETTRELLEESQKQETQYRALFEGIADGIIIHDPDGKILDANQVTCDRLGYSPDELRTMHLEGIVPMERRPDIGAHAKEVLADGTARFETMYLTRDGRLVPCEVMERSVDYYGRTAIQSVARDTTERKQTEKELARRAAQLQAVRDVGLKLTAELDLNSVLCAIASQAIDLLGGTSGGLYLYSPELDVLERVVSIGKLTMPVGNTLRRGEGLSGRIWENGKALIVDDYQSWEGRAASYDCD